MEFTSTQLLIAAAIFAVGGIIGFLISKLLGRGRNIEAETEKETRIRAESANQQLTQQTKDLRLEYDNVRNELRSRGDQLLSAEREKTAAQTELIDARREVEKLSLEIEDLNSRLESANDKIMVVERSNADLNAKYQESLKAIEENKLFIANANQSLRDAFASLSSEALRKNSTSFLDVAKETLGSKVKENALEMDARKEAIETLVKPLSESLKNFDGKVSDIEIKREGAYTEMKTLITEMKTTNQRLEDGTRNLVTALKTSHTRGRYGEIALRRLIETAGLTPYSDFFEQPSVTTEDGRLRPDCAINLPGHRQLILDSKVPLNSYFRSFETEDENEKATLMQKHAAAVRGHFNDLSRKSYWEAFADAPDFVIMYMHIESSYGAALMTDAKLIEDAFDKKVVFATPSTLLAILRTAGYMWQQEKLAAGVLEMQNAGLELYKRANKMLEHFSKIGSSLGSAVGHYNNAVGSMESRVVTQLEKIKDIGGSLVREDLNNPKQIETSIRPVAKQLGNENFVDPANEADDFTQ